MIIPMILQIYTTNNMERTFLRISFEVFGTVQGVYFRACAFDKAIQLGLKGFVMNTDRDTVVGIAEGYRDKIEEYKYWLGNIGSPASRIEKLEISQEEPIESPSYKEFAVRRTY
jgi:acylphosphatase